MKKFLSILLAMALVTGMAACSSNSSEDGSSVGEGSSAAESAQESESGEDITITYNCLWVEDFDSPPQYARKELLKEYYKTHPNVKVQDNSISYEDHMVKLNQWIAADDLPDMFMCRTVDLKQMVANDQIRPFDEYFEMRPGWKEQFIPESFGDMTLDGTIWAAPYQYMSVGFLYCNQELFDKAGAKIPTTTDEFMEACAKLKASGVVPYGFGNKDTSLLGDMLWTTLCASYTGTEWYEDMLLSRGQGDKKWADNPKFMEALKFMEDLGTNEYVNADTNALYEQDAYILFLQESCAMTTFGGWFGEWLEVEDPEFCEKVKLTYLPTAGATPPDTISAGATWGWQTNKNNTGEKLDAILDLMEMFTGEDYTKAALEQGFVRLPCAIPDDADLSNVPVISQQTMKLTEDANKITDYWSAMYDSDLQTTFGECFQSMWAKEMTAEEAAEAIQQTYDDTY